MLKKGDWALRDFSTGFNGGGENGEEGDDCRRQQGIPGRAE